MILRVVVLLVALLIALVQISLLPELGPLGALDLVGCLIVYQLSFRPLREALPVALLGGIVIDSYLDGPWGAVTVSLVVALGLTAALRRRLGPSERLPALLISLAVYKLGSDLCLLVVGLFTGGGLGEFPAQFQLSLTSLIFSGIFTVIVYPLLRQLYLLYDLWSPARRHR